MHDPSSQAIASLVRRFEAVAAVEVRSPTHLDLGRLGRVPCALALYEPNAVGVGGILLVVLAGFDGRLALCAAADVPEAWVIDVDHGWTEVYRHPDEGRYRWREMVLPGEEIAPLCRPETRTRIL